MAGKQVIREKYRSRGLFDFLHFRLASFPFPWRQWIIRTSPVLRLSTFNLPPPSSLPLLLLGSGLILWSRKFLCLLQYSLFLFWHLIFLEGAAKGNTTSPMCYQLARLWVVDRGYTHTGLSVFYFLIQSETKVGEHTESIQIFGIRCLDMAAMTYPGGTNNSAAYTEQWVEDDISHLGILWTLHTSFLSRSLVDVTLSLCHYHCWLQRNLWMKSSICHLWYRALHKHRGKALIQ